MDQINTEAHAIAELSQKPFISTEHSISPMAFLPDGHGSWKSQSLEEFQVKPSRKKGSVALHDVDSFIAIAKRHGTKEASVIYIDADYTRNRVSSTVVFNDHGDETGWRDHRAVFTPRQTKQWDDWIQNNGKKMGQEDFGNFFEQHIADFAPVPGMPNGSAVLTFVLQLQETRTVRYGSATNLQNGMMQLEFTEESDAATKGNLELFKEFALGMSPFFGGKPYQIDAFLRYRIDRTTRQISFWYELKQPEVILQSACEDMIAEIKEQTGLPVVFGLPDRG
jgi:uncharacterized protein YfdQ (DUF2303 family)